MNRASRFFLSFTAKGSRRHLDIRFTCCVSVTPPTAQNVNSSKNWCWKQWNWRKSSQMRLRGLDDVTRWFFRWIHIEAKKWIWISDQSEWCRQIKNSSVLFLRSHLTEQFLQILFVVQICLKRFIMSNSKGKTFHGNKLQWLFITAAS